MKKIPRIADTFDDFFDDLDKGLSSIISDDRLLKKTFFERQEFLNKSWKKSRKCSFPKCTNKSIKRSHTIPKGASIKVIAEDSFVLTPSFSHKIGGMEMIKVGINEASTFPGLCSDHEKIHNSYENRGYFKHNSEVNLQIFRSILREKFRFELETQCLKKDLEIMDELISQEFHSRISNKHGSDVSKKFTGIKTNFPEKKYIEDTLTGHLQSLNEINEIFYSGFEEKLFSEAVLIDINIPICLSGMTTHDHNGKEYVIILSVVPTIKGTLITISYNKDATFLHAKFDFLRGGHELSVIKFIEDAMIKNTDHWFIKPSIWYSINPVFQKKIMKDILTPRVKLINDEYSIFNELKKNMVIELLAVNIVPTTIKNLKRELFLIEQFSDKSISV